MSKKPVTQGEQFVVDFIEALYKDEKDDNDEMNNAALVVHNKLFSDAYTDDERDAMTTTAISMFAVTRNTTVMCKFVWAIYHAGRFSQKVEFVEAMRETSDEFPEIKAMIERMTETKH